MKKLLVTLCMLTTMLTFAQSSFVTLLEKDCTFTVPVDHVVIMDDETFASFYYVKENYDSLKSLVRHYDELLCYSDSIKEVQNAILSSLIAQKDNQLHECNKSFSEARTVMQSSIEDSKRLELEFKTYQKKYQRKEWWNKFFKVTCVFLATTTTVLIAR